MPFHVDDLTLALQYDLVRRIVTADDHVEPEEGAFLRRLCPPERLRAAGFLDEGRQATSRLSEAIAEAARVLPGLSLDEKRVILDACVNACVVDGRLDPREAEEVQRSAALLGLTHVELDAILDAHPAVGVVDADDLVSE